MQIARTASSNPPLNCTRTSDRVLLHIAIQGPRSEFELTGAKNWWIVKSWQGTETFWSYKLQFQNKLSRMRIKAAKIQIKCVLKVKWLKIDGCMHLLLKIDGCSCNLCTCYYDGPEIQNKNQELGLHCCKKVVETCPYSWSIRLYHFLSSCQIFHHFDFFSVSVIVLFSSVNNMKFVFESLKVVICIKEVFTRHLCSLLEIMSLKKVVTQQVIENRLTLLNYVILGSIFDDFLKLLYGLKCNLNTISSKNIDVKMIATDLKAE